MKTLYLISIATYLVMISTADDAYEGLPFQSFVCFGSIHDEDCDTSLPEVFKPSLSSSDTTVQDTEVYLFTKKNPDKAEPLHRCGGKLPPKSDFDPSVDTVLIIHGYLDGLCRTAWMREIRDQLFKRGRYNVILVNWTWGNTMDLSTSAVNSLIVGEQVAFVMKNIMMQKNINGEKFHVIGHSYGCFAVSYAAKTIQRWRKSSKFRRLTALDPAIIPYRQGSGKTVSRSDANFVDVIHTDGGDCFPNFFGNNQILGHIDFYPNGGSVQPSCYPYAVESLYKGDYLYAYASFFLHQFCYHLQSIQFFKVSINHPVGLYVGVRCDSYEEFQSGACKRCCREDFTNCAVAGMDAEKYYKPSKRTGNHTKYFFNTDNYCPFPEDYSFSINKDCTK